MPGQRDIEIVEQAVPRHVGLAADCLFGRRTVIADRSVQLAGLDQLLDRRCRAETCDAEQVMAATMPGGTIMDRGAGRRRGLRQARQRIELTEYADNGFSLAVARDERCRHAGNAALDVEPLLLGVVGEQPR